MDWTKQFEEMAKSWTESQQKMWDNWLETVQQGYVPSQAADMWQKAVATWESSMKNTLEAQVEWTRIWIESLNTTAGIPKETVKWAQQAQEMTNRWNEVQQQFWQNWFEFVKKIDPAKMPENWEEESKKTFQAWQESAQKLMEEQLEWTRMWSDKQPKAKASNKK